MPADEVTHGPDVDGSRARTGPRHAAPKKLLFTRLHMPAGKAIASVAMPTAVLMGMGFTSTLAIADSGGSPASNSQKASDYKDCVEALGGKVDDTSASPTPSAGASTGPAKPGPSAPGGDKADGSDGKASSPDSGSGDDDKGEAPAAGSASRASEPAAAPSAQPSASADTPSPSASSTGADGGLLGSIGDALGDVLTGGKKSGTPSAGSSPSATAPAPSSSTTPAPSATGDEGEPAGKPGGKSDDTPGAVKGSDKPGESAAPSTSESASPSPSASASDAAEDCEKATDDVGGVDNKQLLADDPWYLNASSLLLKGADYQGVVEVRTASGKVKKVLKYVISDGTDIGDLHQTVKDKASGKTYHVQAGKGTTSTIRDGDTTMYTESISGKLFGLIPITFSPDSPPPLNIPLIYFTDVTVQQAGQFGGTLTVPKLHQYAD
ncbi:hypothetical protein [Streptomyces sp. NPDC001091]